MVSGRILTTLILIIAVTRATPNRNLQVRQMRPSNFTFPPGCGPTKRVGNLTYCITGSLDLGREWLVDFNMNFFDVFVNNSVKFGLNLAIEDVGTAKRLSVNTGGRATVVKHDFFPDWRPKDFVGAVTIGTRGGNTTYDNSTKKFVSNFEIYGDVDIFTQGRKFMSMPFSTPFGYASLGQDFDVEFNGSVVATGGDEQANSRLNFSLAMSTLSGSVLNWHLYGGLDVSIYWEKYGRHNFTIPFVDEDIQIP
ncbi:hypothetical protein Pmar_PMAR013823 [Perkinsus marinus ATCC 50983]|uniref:Uncharacterized protein n=1 Tax=Perkinsus marinus (strain ATCC 50983 / TXsc) TaxID=423536 RepID=C5L909_PERM5|nr:hypothetical protein Pmar_PMAR013823 [Perkinsus marinus ATCC 50983]EER06773.1 hypothetical protein Pmar_PMAR013823 [Perkinsus marinus ATCC 50983]|eukprot:XP_002774957.1 hypothetical protein Pmar_PMAR013823 [Perkinsus marinus ATCC 50983]